MKELLFPVCDAFVRQKKEGESVEIRIALTQASSGHHHALSKGMFEHIYMFLCSLRCWTVNDTPSLPWTTKVRYSIDGVDITPQEKGETYWLEAEDSGETGGILATRTVDHGTLRLASNTTTNDDFFLHMTLVTYNTSKKCLRRNAMFNNVHIEKSKTFTYTSTFTWKYQLSLRWTSPLIDSMEDCAAKTDIVFKKEPTCHLTILCDGMKIADSAYLSDSLFCKICDLLPTAYRDNVSLQSIAPKTGVSSDTPPPVEEA